MSTAPPPPLTSSEMRQRVISHANTPSRTPGRSGGLSARLHEKNPGSFHRLSAGEWVVGVAVGVEVGVGVRWVGGWVGLLFNGVGDIEIGLRANYVSYVYYRRENCYPVVDTDIACLVGFFLILRPYPR